jgi:hypothetical protein
MSRHSSLLSTALALFVAISLTTSTAQEALPGTVSLVDVVYLYYGSTIETYNVDRTTGVPHYRQQISVPLTGIFIRPAPDDHFVYAFGTDPASNASELMVYPTDRDGSLQDAAIQVENFDYPLFDIDSNIDPNSHFAYTIAPNRDSQGYAVSWRWLLSVIDPENGTVQPPVVVAQEPGNGPCSQWEYGTLWFVGFSPRGNQLYEEWNCGSVGGDSEGYYTRQIDQLTGELSPAVYTAGGYGEGQGGVQVSFAPNAILELNTYEDFSLSVFPLSGGTTPIFTCTTEMFEACSNATSYTVDPEGKNIFFQISPDTILGSRLLLDCKRIVPTGYYIPESGGLVFSPDDALIYLYQGTPYIQIYTFDPDTGSVISAERSISGPASGFGSIPAVRW